MLGPVEEIRIATPGGEVSASVHGDGRTTLVLGHGAGGNRRHAALVRLADALAGTGRRVALYNFLYTERRQRRPDPPALLEATTRAVAEHLRSAFGTERLVHGGRSMGGRIASQVVAAGAPADGLVFLAYPLHPPGQHEKLRDAHLDRIAVPMLFVQGTRDAFARRDLLDAVLSRLGPRARLHSVEGGDHSFGVPKSSGRRAADVEAEILTAIEKWLQDGGL
jgi:predicted alpha/beta-hydrolase family hydrolase